MSFGNKNSKPNVIFILIDDMGWKDLGCYGSEFYETPNIDSLAAKGVRFENAYATCPVCSPSRASIMTGKYPATLGLTDWIGAHTKGKLIDAPYVDHLSTREISIASTLRDVGYRTWHVGKWHLGKEQYYPDKHGFDVNIGGCHLGHPPNGYYSPYDIETLEDGPNGEYLTDRLTDEAIRLIEANEGEPFFLNLWYYAVHTPIEGKKEDVAYFAQKAKLMGLDQVETFSVDENFPSVDKKHLNVTRRLVQSDPGYAAMIRTLDSNIGRLFQSLDEKGIRDNTLIIFTSDNGGLATAEGSPTCNAPLKEGKGWTYEGGIRVPLIVDGPGVNLKDSVSNHLVTGTDYYPTILDVCGLSLLPEQHSDGGSFWETLSGKKQEERAAMYWHYPHYGNQGGTPACMIRKGNYKLIEFFETNTYELYNLEDDKEECHDLSKKQPELAVRLHSELVGWRGAVEAKMPAVNPDYCN